MAANFIATVVDGKLRIVATAVGNQTNTTATVTRGTNSTADTTPTVASTDGYLIPDWTIPVEDGYNGVTGLDGVSGSRGSGRFDRSFTVTTAVAPSVGLASSTVFNSAARCAVAGGYPFNTSGNTVSCNSKADDTGIAVALVTPVDGDIVVLTVTESDGGIATRAAIHNGQGTDPTFWVDFEVQIDGNLLVDGTIVANKLAANSVSASNIQAGAIVLKSVTNEDGSKSITPGELGAGSAATTGSRMVINGSRIEIYEGTTLRVVLGDLDPPTP